MVSQETRFSLPSRCSTTTRMVSDIKSASSCLLLARTLPGFARRTAEGGRPHIKFHSKLSQHSYFVAQFVYQLFCDLGWRAFYVLGLFRFLRHVEAFDLLQVPADRGLHLRERHLADGLVFRLLDADQRGVPQLVNAGLNREHGGQRHIDELEESGFEFALH